MSDAEKQLQLLGTSSGSRNMALSSQLTNKPPLNSKKGYKVFILSPTELARLGLTTKIENGKAVIMPAAKVDTPSSSSIGRTVLSTTSENARKSKCVSLQGSANPVTVNTDRGVFEVQLGNQGISRASTGDLWTSNRSTQNLAGGNSSYNCEYVGPGVPDSKTGVPEVVTSRRRQSNRRIIPMFAQHWNKSLQDLGFVRCPLRACNYISLSFFDIGRHYSLCTGTSQDSENFCHSCNGRLGSKKDYEMHVLLSHSDNKVKIEPLQGKVSEIKIESPKSQVLVRKRPYSKVHKVSWNIALEEKGYVCCFFKNCKFLALDLEEMIQHYRICNGTGSSASIECAVCNGRVETLEKLAVHLARSHSPQYLESMKMENTAVIGNSDPFMSSTSNDSGEGKVLQEVTPSKSTSQPHNMIQSQLCGSYYTSAVSNERVCRKQQDVPLTVQACEKSLSETINLVNFDHLTLSNSRTTEMNSILSGVTLGDSVNNNNEYSLSENWGGVFGEQDINSSFYGYEPGLQVAGCDNASIKSENNSLDLGVHSLFSVYETEGDRMECVQTSKLTKFVQEALAVGDGAATSTVDCTRTYGNSSSMLSNPSRKTYSRKRVQKISNTVRNESATGSIHSQPDDLSIELSSIKIHSQSKNSEADDHDVKPLIIESLVVPMPVKVKLESLNTIIIDKSEYSNDLDDKPKDLNVSDQSVTLELVENPTPCSEKAKRKNGHHSSGGADDPVILEANPTNTIVIDRLHDFFAQAGTPTINKLVPSELKRGKVSQNIPLDTSSESHRGVNSVVSSSKSAECESHSSEHFRIVEKNNGSASSHQTSRPKLKGVDKSDDAPNLLAVLTQQSKPLFPCIEENSGTKKLSTPLESKNNEKIPSNDSSLSILASKYQSKDSQSVRSLSYQSCSTDISSPCHTEENLAISPVTYGREESSINFSSENKICPNFTVLSDNLHICGQEVVPEITKEANLDTCEPVGTLDVVQECSTPNSDEIITNKFSLITSKSSVNVTPQVKIQECKDENSRHEDTNKLSGSQSSSDLSLPKPSEIMDSLNICSVNKTSGNADATINQADSDFDRPKSMESGSTLLETDIIDHSSSKLLDATTKSFGELGSGCNSEFNSVYHLSSDDSSSLLKNADTGSSEKSTESTKLDNSGLVEEEIISIECNPFISIASASIEDSAENSYSDCVLPENRIVSNSVKTDFSVSDNSSSAGYFAETLQTSQESVEHVLTSSCVDSHCIDSCSVLPSGTTSENSPHVDTLVHILPPACLSDKVACVPHSANIANLVNGEESVGMKKVNQSVPQLQSKDVSATHSDKSMPEKFVTSPDSSITSKPDDLSVLPSVNDPVPSDVSYGTREKVGHIEINEPSTDVDKQLTMLENNSVQSVPPLVNNEVIGTSNYAKEFLQFSNVSDKILSDEKCSPKLDTPTLSGSLSSSSCAHDDYTHNQQSIVETFEVNSDKLLSEICASTNSVEVEEMICTETSSNSSTASKPHLNNSQCSTTSQDFTGTLPSNKVELIAQSKLTSVEDKPVSVDVSSEIKKARPAVVEVVPPNLNDEVQDQGSIRQSFVEKPITSQLKDKRDSEFGHSNIVILDPFHSPRSKDSLLQLESNNEKVDKVSDPPWFSSKRESSHEPNSNGDEINVLSKMQGHENILLGSCKENSEIHCGDQTAVPNEIDENLKLLSYEKEVLLNAENPSRLAGMKQPTLIPVQQSVIVVKNSTIPSPSKMISKDLSHVTEDNAASQVGNSANNIPYSLPCAQNIIVDSSAHQSEVHIDKECLETVSLAKLPADKFESHPENSVEFMSITPNLYKQPVIVTKDVSTSSKPSNDEISSNLPCSSLNRFLPGDISRVTIPSELENDKVIENETSLLSDKTAKNMKINIAGAQCESVSCNIYHKSFYSSTSSQPLHVSPSTLSQSNLSHHTVIVSKNYSSTSSSVPVCPVGDVDESFLPEYSHDSKNVCESEPNIHSYAGNQCIISDQVKENVCRESEIVLVNKSCEEMAIVEETPPVGNAIQPVPLSSHFNEQSVIVTKSFVGATKSSISSQADVDTPLYIGDLTKYTAGNFNKNFGALLGGSSKKCSKASSQYQANENMNQVSQDILEKISPQEMESQLSDTNFSIPSSPVLHNTSVIVAKGSTIPSTALLNNLFDKDAALCKNVSIIPSNDHCQSSISKSTIQSCLEDSSAFQFKKTFLTVSPDIEKRKQDEDSVENHKEVTASFRRPFEFDKVSLQPSVIVLKNSSTIPPVTGPPNNMDLIALNSNSLCNMEENVKRVNSSYLKSDENDSCSLPDKHIERDAVSNFTKVNLITDCHSKMKEKVDDTTVLESDMIMSNKNKRSKDNTTTTYVIDRVANTKKPLKDTYLTSPAYCQPSVIVSNITSVPCMSAAIPSSIKSVPAQNEHIVVSNESSYMTNFGNDTNIMVESILTTQDSLEVLPKDQSKLTLNSSQGIVSNSLSALPCSFTADDSKCSLPIPGKNVLPSTEEKVFIPIPIQCNNTISKYNDQSLISNHDSKFSLENNRNVSCNKMLPELDTRLQGSNALHSSLLPSDIGLHSVIVAKDSSSYPLLSASEDHLFHTSQQTSSLISDEIALSMKCDLRDTTDLGPISPEVASATLTNFVENEQSELVSHNTCNIFSEGESCKVKALVSKSFSYEEQSAENSLLRDPNTEIKSKDYAIDGSHKGDGKHEHISGSLDQKLINELPSTSDSTISNQDQPGFEARNGKSEELPDADVIQESCINNQSLAHRKNCESESLDIFNNASFDVLKKNGQQSSLEDKGIMEQTSNVLPVTDIANKDEAELSATCELQSSNINENLDDNGRHESVSHNTYDCVFEDSQDETQAKINVDQSDINSVEMEPESRNETDTNNITEDVEVNKKRESEEHNIASVGSKVESPPVNPQPPPEHMMEIEQSVVDSFKINGENEPNPCTIAANIEIDEKLKSVSSNLSDVAPNDTESKLIVCQSFSSQVDPCDLEVADKSERSTIVGELTGNIESVPKDMNDIIAEQMVFVCKINVEQPFTVGEGKAKIVYDSDTINQTKSASHDQCDGKMFDSEIQCNPRNGQNSPTKNGNLEQLNLDSSQIKTVIGRKYNRINQENSIPFNISERYCSLQELNLKKLIAHNGEKDTLELLCTTETSQEERATIVAPVLSTTCDEKCDQLGAVSLLKHSDTITTSNACPDSENDPDQSSSHFGCSTKSALHMNDSIISPHHSDALLQSDIDNCKPVVDSKILPEIKHSAVKTPESIEETNMACFGKGKILSTGVVEPSSVKQTDERVIDFHELSEIENVTIAESQNKYVQQKVSSDEINVKPPFIMGEFKLQIVLNSDSITEECESVSHDQYNPVNDQSIESGACKEEYTVGKNLEDHNIGEVNLHATVNQAETFVLYDARDCINHIPSNIVGNPPSNTSSHSTACDKAEGGKVIDDITSPDNCNTREKMLQTPKTNVYPEQEEIISSVPLPFSAATSTPLKKRKNYEVASHNADETKSITDFEATPDDAHSGRGKRKRNKVVYSEDIIYYDNYDMKLSKKRKSNKADAIESGCNVQEGLADDSYLELNKGVRRGKRKRIQKVYDDDYDYFFLDSNDEQWSEKAIENSSEIQGNRTDNDSRMTIGKSEMLENSSGTSKKRRKKRAPLNVVTKSSEIESFPCDSIKRQGDHSHHFENKVQMKDFHERSNISLQLVEETCVEKGNITEKQTSLMDESCSKEIDDLILNSHNGDVTSDLSSRLLNNNCEKVSDVDNSLVATYSEENFAKLCDVTNGNNKERMQKMLDDIVDSSSETTLDNVSLNFSNDPVSLTDCSKSINADSDSSDHHCDESADENDEDFIPTPSRRGKGRGKGRGSYRGRGRARGRGGKVGGKGRGGDVKPKVKVPVPEFVDKLIQCGKCKEEMMSSAYQHHNFVKHNGLGWLEGEPPFDLDDRKKMSSVLWKVLKSKKRKYLCCEICGRENKSVVGFISHLNSCQKSLEELEAMKESCPICGRFMLPTSLKVHMTLHKNEKKIKELEQELEEIGPRKRAAAQKAASLMQEFIKDEEPEKPEMPGSPESPGGTPGTETSSFYSIWKRVKPSNPVIGYWKKQIAKDGKAACRNSKCKFRGSSLEEMTIHFGTCKFIPKKNYQCLFCDFSSPDEHEMQGHVSAKHENDNESGEEFDVKVESTKSYLKISSKMKFLHKEQSGTVYGDRPYLPALRWNFKFHSKNDSKCLFPKAHTTANDWIPVLDAECVHYIPETKESVPVSYVCMKGKSIDPFRISDLKWIKFRTFQSEIIEGVPLFFAGGPVWALAWCPLPLQATVTPGAKINQFLAVSCHRGMDDRYYNDDKYEGEGLIQLWDFGPLENVHKPLLPPQLVLGIAHEYGVVWCLQWCPSGCYEEENPNAGERLQRLGLLAAAFSDGVIRIFSVCFPSQLTGKRGKYPIFKCEASIILLLDSLQTVRLGGNAWNCMRLAWYEGKGHRFVAGGFSNGMVAVWDLETTSPLLSKMEGNCRIVYPFHVFQAHQATVTAVDFSREEGGRFLMTGSVDCTMKLWDLEDTTSPTTFVRKGMVTDGLWLPHWPSSVTSFDDVYNMGHCNGTLNTSRGFGFKPYPLLAQNSAAWSISSCDWVNGIAQGTQSGELTAIFPHQLLLAVDTEKGMKDKRMVLSYIELNDFEENSKQHTCNDLCNQPCRKTSTIINEIVEMKEEEGEDSSDSALVCTQPNSPTRLAEGLTGDVTGDTESAVDEEGVSFVIERHPRTGKQCTVLPFKKKPSRGPKWSKNISTGVTNLSSSELQGVGEMRVDTPNPSDVRSRCNYSMLSEPEKKLLRTVKRDMERLNLASKFKVSFPLHNATPKDSEDTGSGKPLEKKLGNPDNVKVYQMIVSSCNKERTKHSHNSTGSENMSESDSSRTNSSDRTFRPGMYDDVSKKFGIILCDFYTRDMSDMPQESRLWIRKSEKMTSPPVHMYPIGSINKVQWNPNCRSFLWLATGYQCGLVRVPCVSGMHSRDVDRVLQQSAAHHFASPS